MGRQGLNSERSLFIPLVGLLFFAVLLILLLFPWVHCPTCNGEGIVLWLGGSEYVPRTPRDGWMYAPKFEMVLDCQVCQKRGRISLLRRWQGVPAMTWTTLVY